MSLRPPAGIGTPAGTLENVLARHQVWLESQGRQGSRAELAACELRGVDLRERDLRRADLATANLAGADLSRAKLCGANLAAANFRHAILCDANLSGFEASETGRPGGEAAIPPSVPTILDGADFGGADLTIAKFPRRFGFAAQVQEALDRASRARLLAIALGILLVVVVFQIGAARDERLLLPEREAADTVILDAVTGKYFFLGAAALAVLAYGIWVFGPLRRLCDPRNQLPARLPDGGSIDANRALWPLNMLAAQWMPRLREDRPDWRARMPVWLTLAALFVVPPVVSVLVWWRFLSLHEWWSSALLAAVAAAAIGAARFGWGRSAQALGGWAESAEVSEAPVPKARPALRAVAVSLLSAAALTGVSFAVLERDLAPYLAAHADIAFENLADHPPRADGEGIAAVRGPNLAGRNLRHARISYSSLVNADLRNARLDHAAITISDLRRADLSGADLREAALFASNLESAALSGADLRGATLLCVAGLTGSQLAAARTDEATTLPDGSAGPFRLGSNALAVKAGACAHWAPGNPQPFTVEIPQPLSTAPGTISPMGGISPGPVGEAAPGEAAAPTEPDLSPIEDLKPLRKAPAPEESKE